MTRKVWAIYAINPTTEEFHAINLTDKEEWSDDAIYQVEKKDSKLSSYLENTSWHVFAIDMIVSPGKEPIFVQLRRSLDNAGIPRSKQEPYLDAFRESWLNR